MLMALTRCEPSIASARQVSEVLRTKCVVSGGGYRRADTAVVNAIASGSQHSTMSAIRCHRRSPLC
jgi:hypothetical protein